MSPSAAIAAMNSVARSLRELSKVPAQAAREASDNLDEVMRDQFGSETDPYGKPWAPLAESTVQRKHGDARILRDSDYMLDSLRVAPMSGAGISVTLDPPYTAFHQVGTRNMPARRLLPVAALPATWRAAIQSALDKSFGRWADGARA